jgi:LCP family protein required for cell wall assembly
MPDTSRDGRPRRTWGQRLVIATGLLLSTMLVAGAAAVGYQRWRLEQIGTYDDLSLVQSVSGLGENYLIVGSDSREAVDDDDANAGAFLNGEDPGGQRSDTLIVARIDDAGDRVDLLSLPRDLWVPIAGTGSRERINTAYGEGRQQLIDTIEEDFGIPINHYVEVDFRGFKNLVESIDGIPMYFDTAMRDLRSGLWISGEGCVRLDGDQALALARSRELQYLDDGQWLSDPTGDLGRITRQQILVLKAVERSVDLDLTDPTKFDRIIDVGVESVTIDEGIDFDDIAGLMKRFGEVTDETMVTHSLPVVPYTTAGGAAVLDVNEAAAAPVLDVFRGVDPDGLVPSDVDVRVLNATGIEGHAAAVAEALGYIGFTIVETSGLGTIPLAVSQVRYHPDEQEAAERVTRHLPPGVELVEDRELRKGSVIVVTGLDLQGVSEQPMPESALSTPRTAPVGDQLPTTTSTTTEVADESATRGPTTTTPAAVGRTPGEEPDDIDCR